MPNLGPQELFILLIIVLVLFGGKNIPNLAKSLGTGIREFKRAVNTDAALEEPTKTAATDLPKPPVS